MRIAVLDVDPEDLEFVNKVLSSGGHSCHLFSEGRALIHRLQRESFDLVTLDWNVADIQADDVLAWVRTKGQAAPPVLLITNRPCETDITQALDAGADDYIVKPVTASVLLARVTNLLRRAYRQQVIGTSQEFGEYVFDLQKGQVFHKRQLVSLSYKEFQLALLLFRNIGRSLSRAHLVETVWQRSPDVTSRTLDTHISEMRIKLDLRQHNGYRVIPIYGFGYRLETIDDNHSEA